MFNFWGAFCICYELLVLACQLLGSDGKAEVYGGRCPDFVRAADVDPDRSVYLVAAQIERGSRRLTARLRQEQYEAQIMKAIETGHRKAFARLMDAEDETTLTPKSSCGRF